MILLDTNVLIYAFDSGLAFLPLVKRDDRRRRGG